MATGVEGQQAPTSQGLTATLDVTQRLEYSDNPDLNLDKDSDLFGRTILEFGLTSVTSIQRFNLNLGTDIEEFRDDESTFNFANSFVGLGYGRSTNNALFGFNGLYRETDTDSDDLDDFDIDGNVINQDDGTRESIRLAAQGGIGLEAPVGVSFDWTYDEINFSNTNDPNLRNNSTNDFSAQANFRLRPTLSANLTARYIDFDTETGGVNRETTGFGAGLIMDISSILQADLALSYDTIERTGAEVGTDSGVSGSFELTRATPTGSVGFIFETFVEANDNGRRSLFAFNQDMQLPRGTLNYSVGVTGAGATVGSDPLVNLDYTQERSTSLLSLGVSQRVTVDSDNNEQINSTVRASYDRRINTTSSWGLDFTLFDRNELDNNPNDGRRTEIGLAYQHDITKDWGLVAGYTYTISEEDNEDQDRSRNTLFVGLSRSFDWRP